MKKITAFIFLLGSCVFIYAQENKIHVEGPIQVGNTNNSVSESGTIRWSGNDFEGWNGSDWKSFTISSNSTKIFETFQEFKSFDFNSDTSINRVVTLGHTIEGIGKAEYIKAGIGTPNMGNEGELITSDSSRWALISRPIRIEHFGAIPKGSQIFGVDIPLNNTQKINNFLAFITENNVGIASFTGIYEVSNTIKLGYQSDNLVAPKVMTTHIVGSPTIILVNSQQIDTVFEIFAFKFGFWDGRITVDTKGTSNWSARKSLFCVKISGCTRSVFGGFICKGAAVFGLLCSSELISSGNSSLLNLGDCRFEFCGSGSGSINSASYFMTSDWLSNQVEVSSGGSISSIVEVSELPDSTFLSRARAYPFMFMENGEFHYVSEINQSTKEVRIHPSLDTTLIDSTFKWIFGGGLALRGSDVGIVNINSVDAVNCAIGLDLMSIYGPVAQRVVAQSCFSGICFGLRASAAMVSTHILALYSEGNVGAFIPLIRSGAGNYNISTVYNLNLETDILYIKNRGVNNLLSNFNGLPGYTITRRGKYLSYEKTSKNKSETQSSITYKIDNPNKVQTYKRNNATIFLDSV